MKIKLSFIAGLMVLLAGCAGPEVAYSSDSPDNIETSINQLLDEFEHTCELAPSSGNAVQRLQALLHDLHRGAITIQSNNPENSSSIKGRSFRTKCVRCSVDILCFHLWLLGAR